ncbi:MAG: hypothetical protein LBD07_00415 [Spirochaetaceae bacterium]|jgi:hypothetical protein|nr:hypothetical protein [Spirochaetaceae bacterium]
MAGRLEASVVPLIPVLARMYYLALTDDAMRNHAFKADLLKTILNNSSISDYAANMTNDRITDYIQELLPFLRYNY